MNFNEYLFYLNPIQEYWENFLIRFHLYPSSDTSRCLDPSQTPVSLHNFSMASPIAISHCVTKLDNARSWNPCPCNIHAKVCHINKLLPRS